MRALETACDLGGDEHAGNFVEEMMALDKAPQNLKVAYEDALKMANNLPTDEKLVGGGSED